MDLVNCCDITNNQSLFADGPAREHLSVDALDDGDDITGNVHTTPTITAIKVNKLCKNNILTLFEQNIFHGRLCLLRKRLHETDIQFKLNAICLLVYPDTSYIQFFLY